MRTKQVAPRSERTKRVPVKNALVKKDGPAGKSKTARTRCVKKLTEKVNADKNSPLKKKGNENSSKKTATAVRKTSRKTVKKEVATAKTRASVRAFDSKRAARQIEMAGSQESAISVEALKIALLLSAIDGHCDENEIAKFRTIADACGGLSGAKIDQVIAQTQRRITELETLANGGASEDEVVEKFLSEASNIGIGRDCRNFILWMSVAMVDGDYSCIERKAIAGLQQRANNACLSFVFHSKRADISDVFLKRCELILAGIYKADATGDKILLRNRMKSLQTLVEIAEA